MKSNITIPFNKGQITGLSRIGYRNCQYYSFQGIPYAQPPVGELRFKAPEPINEWDRELDATQEGPECYQRHMLRFEDIVGSEDCLYLNVYTPTIKKLTRLLPVMIWIHGGAFVCGSGRSDVYGPDFLMTQNIVLVTFNYRVGLLGFLSFKDKTVDVPGNAGLKDQLLVLKWVNNHIKHFNGNKSNVTLFGQGAGAASVHLHVLSPLSTGLFHRAIMQSGCALNPWVNGLLGTGRLVGRVLGLKGSDYEILSHLRSLKVEEIFELQEILANNNAVNVIWLCSPIVENKKLPDSFITDEPINIIQSGNYTHVPTIIGYTSREGIYWDIYNRQLTGQSKLITDFTKVIPNNVHCRRGSLLSYTIADKIKNFYYGPRLHQTRMGRHPRLKKMDPQFQLMTDVFFLRGIFITLKHHMATAPKVPIYYYRFCYETPLNVFKQMLPPVRRRKYPGAAHGDDLGYLFTNDFTPDCLQTETYKAVQNIIQFWTSFAATGKPSNFTNFKWDPTTKDDFHCINLSCNQKLEYNPDMDRMHFWKQIYENDQRTNAL